MRNWSDYRASVGIVHRAHQILNRMRIPPRVDMEDDPDDENHISALFYRLKTVKLYTDAIRGKWLREKKKAAAANRALEDYRRGNTKSWRQRAEALQKMLDEAKLVFAKEHKPHTHVAYTGDAAVVQLVRYLVDRSNQLFANDSAAERQAIEKTKLAVHAKEEAEHRAREAESRLAAYEHRFGKMETLVEELERASEGGRPTTADLAREADSFPFRRGNPYYLGDYETAELLDEVSLRVGRGEISGRKS